MENASQAIKMAGSVLLFVIAISVIILSFNQARITADTILDYRDRETYYINGDYYYKASNNLVRQVSLEAIIPSIIRAYTENYKIVFEGLGDNPIYTIKKSGGDNTEIKKFSIDLESNINTDFENVRLANNEQKAEFLCGILYHKFKNDDENAFNNKFGIKVGDTALYELLKNNLQNGKKIEEYLGVYYQDDSEDMPDVNKTEKRIITYKIE